MRQPSVGHLRSLCLAQQINGWLKEKMEEHLPQDQPHIFFLFSFSLSFHYSKNNGKRKEKKKIRIGWSLMAIWNKIKKEKEKIGCWGSFQHNLLSFLILLMAIISHRRSSSIRNTSINRDYKRELSFHLLMEFSFPRLMTACVSRRGSACEECISCYQKKSSAS